MGSSTQKTTSTSGPSNPDVNKLLSTLSQGIRKSYQPGGSTYVAPSSTTTGSWNAALEASNNPAFSGGLAGALQSFGNRATGAEIGNNAPGYAQMRSDLTDDVLTTIDGRYNTSGMLGSDRNVTNASRGLASALGELDYTNYRNSIGDQERAAGMLGDLYQQSLIPSSVQGAVGAAQDADAQAKALGGIDYLSRFTQLLGGAAGASPQTTTQTTPSTPLWQSLLGLGVAAL